MHRWNIYNKLFIVLCVALITFIAVKVPHEKETKGAKSAKTEKVTKSEMD